MERKKPYMSNEEELHVQMTEAAAQRCSLKKLFSIYGANLQENTHAEG